MIKNASYTHSTYICSDHIRGVKDSNVDSRPTLEWSASQSSNDLRVPVYVDEYLGLDARGYDLLFMDPDAGPKLMSFGLRGLQDFFLNDFVEDLEAVEDLVEGAFTSPKSSVRLCSCASKQ